jgi:hypothetical protein
MTRTVFVLPPPRIASVCSPKKVEDIAGLNRRLPRRAAVVEIDEKPKLNPSPARTPAPNPTCHASAANVGRRPAIAGVTARRSPSTSSTERRSCVVCGAVAVSSSFASNTPIRVGSPTILAAPTFERP